MTIFPSSAFKGTHMASKSSILLNKGDREDKSFWVVTKGVEKESSKNVLLSAHQS